MRLVSLITLAALGLGACTTSSMSSGNSMASNGGDCFLSYRVTNFDPVDDNHIRISLTPSQSYILTTQSSMRTTDWTRPLTFDAPNQICVGDVQGVKLIGSEPRRQFIVTHVEREASDHSAPQGS